MIKLFLITGFIVGSGLDSFTTWLCVFRLPPGLRGTEMNPVFGDIRKHWRRAVAIKTIGTLVLAGVLVFADTFICLAAVVLMGLVVASNAYVYLARKMLKRKVLTLGSFCYRVCGALHLPGAVAYLMAAAVMVAVAYGVALGITG